MTSNNKLIYPHKKEDLLKELKTISNYEHGKYFKNFPDLIDNFSKSFSELYRSFNKLQDIKSKRKNKNSGVIDQLDYVIFFSYQTIENLFSSFKLYILGFQAAAGNLMRQSVEGIAMVLLFCQKNEISRKERVNKKTIEKKFNYYQSFIKNSKFTRAHNAIKLLEENREFLGLTQHGVDIFKTIKDYNNKYSHPTKISTASLMSYKEPGKMFFGGGFDENKIKSYAAELESRIIFSKRLTEVFCIVNHNSKIL